MSEAVPISVLLAEKLRREEERLAAGGQPARFLELAAQCRAEFHPKQRRAYQRRQGRARLAVFATRRAGKSRGGLRETMARCLEAQPNRPERIVYCNETREEAYKIAWRSDRRDGWRDIVEQLGLVVARSTDEFARNPATDVLVNESKLTIDFRNGSQLAIFAADKDNAADKFRGGEKTLIWVDEAQKFGPLAYFLNDVASKALAKPAGQEPGEFWVSGTADRSLSGEFYEITRDPVKRGPRRAGWEVHEMSVVDNPYFGATPKERWDATAGVELFLNGWDPADPPAQFIREWGTPDGKVMWTTEDTLHVFCVHQKKPAEYAAVCVDEFGLYDHKRAVRDLPPTVPDAWGNEEPINWYYALGLDFGYVDPFAWVLWAFSPQIADIFEMGSWKKAGLPTDDVEAIIMTIWDAVGMSLVSIRADAGGAMAKSSIVGWQEKLKIPIEEAEKHGKDAWTDLFNGELWARRVHFRRDSAMLMECRELQYRVLPGGRREIWKNRVSNGVMHGDHCVDAGCRYSYRDLVSRRTEFGPLTPMTQADIDKAQERALLKSLDVGLPGYENNQQDGW